MASSDEEDYETCPEVTSCLCHVCVPKFLPQVLFGGRHTVYAYVPYVQDEDDGQEAFQSIRIPLGHPPVLFGLPGSALVGRADG